MRIFSSFLNMLFLSTVIIVLSYSCKCDREDAQSKDEAIIEDTIRLLKPIHIDKNTIYKVPSPLELYSFMKNDNLNFNNEILNPIENKDKYFTTTQKAINFGIYASDLAYCSVFNQNQETFRYFQTTKDMADELGIIDGFDKSMLERIDKNINNSDSLFEISADSYWNATIALEGQDETNLLPFIIVGGWLESVYIATSSIDKFTSDNKSIIRIAEQRLLLDNLISYLGKFSDNREIIKLINQLLELQNDFDVYDEDENIIMSEDKFNSISLKVKKLRTEFAG